MHLMRRMHEIHKKYIYIPSGVNVRIYTIDFKELFVTSKTFAALIIGLMIYPKPELIRSFTCLAPFHAMLSV